MTMIPVLRGVLSRGGKVKSKFTTSIIKRHFEKYHPKELTTAEKRKTDEIETNNKKNSSVSTFFSKYKDPTPSGESPPSTISPTTSSSSSTSTVPIYDLIDPQFFKILCKICKH